MENKTGTVSVDGLGLEFSEISEEEIIKLDSSGDYLVVPHETVG